MAGGKQVQFKAAELLIRIKLLKKTTQPVVKTVIKSVDEIFDAIFELLEEKLTKECGEDGVLGLSEIIDAVRTFRGFSIFDEVSSDSKLETYLKKEYSYVPPIKEVLLKTNVVHGTSTKEVVIDYGYYIPFLPSMQQVLNCPEILQCVLNPRPTKDGVFTSPLDGYFYQNHPVVRKDPHTLGVNTYCDGVCMTDTAGSKSSQNSITFIYWSLLNIYPELRSTEDSVFLLGAAESSVIKKHGFDKIMEDFVQGMKSLYNGIHLQIDNELRLFHGILVFNSADNPAAANLGGFKETHFAEKLCRQCLVPKVDLYKSFDESSFPPRDIHSHAVQVQEVEAFRRTKANKHLPDPSVVYGINHRSVFMEIPLCDVTKCFPQDFMHTTIEGTLRLEICLLLSHAVEYGKMSLATINQRIARFSKHCGVNKPAQISKDHLDKTTLHQTSSETLNLAYILPFVLRKKNSEGVLESVCAKENLKCYILRLELVDLLMSREFTLNDVDKIRTLKEEHSLLFQKLYPDREIPKMHYECHYATQILLFGPLTQHWCFRFESKHSYFKKLYRMLRSVKDLPGTLCTNHQRRQAAVMMLSARGCEKPYVRASHSFGAPVVKALRTLPQPHQDIIAQAFPTVSSTINSYKTCVQNGVKYSKNSVLVVSFPQGSLPVFGEVLSIFRHEGEGALIIKLMETYNYVQELKSFRVGYVLGANRLSVLKLSDLVHHHPLIVIKSTSAVYVSVPCKYFK